MSSKDIINQVIEEMCDKYCKWSEQWNEEAEGMALIDSEHCKNCPLNLL